MFGSRVSRRILMIVVLTAVVSVGLVKARRLWATASTAQSTLIGRATYRPDVGDVLFVHREQPGSNWDVLIQSRPALDVASQVITFAPGTQSGWHNHPGPVFVSVIQGEMTFYEGDDPDCKPTVRHAGEGFLDVGQHAHIARNESGQTATNVVRYLVPPGAPLRIDQPNPGNCPF